MRLLLPILFLIISLNGIAQNYADKRFYLLDSLDLKNVEQYDITMMDSMLTIYHETSDMVKQYQAIEYLANYLVNDAVWPRYNNLLVNMASGKDDCISRLYVSKGLNNKGYFETHRVAERAIQYLDQALEAVKGCAFDPNSLFYSENQGNLSSIYNNLAVVYDSQNDSVIALKYYKLSAKIAEEVGDSSGMGSAYNNIANYYGGAIQLDTAMLWHHKSIAVRKAQKSWGQLATSYVNVIDVMRELNQIDSAFYYADEAIRLTKLSGNVMWYAYANHMKSRIFRDLKQLDSSLFYQDKCLQLSLQQNFSTGIVSASEGLYYTYKNLGKHKKALEMYELFIKTRDEIKNEETQKAAIRQQTKYEFEKAELLKQQKLKEEIRKEKEKTQRRNNLQYSIIFIAILGVFGLVLGLGKIEVSPKFAEGLIFFAFLLFFEFLLVLTDPYIEQVTNGEPMYKLLANALLAGVIFPAHGFFEAKLKSRLIRKNKV